jgi:small subunit ribosomal protein S1
MKQLVPTGLDEYITEHKQGDVVSGRLLEVSGDHARVELGEGIQAHCSLKGATSKTESHEWTAGKADLSALGAMLQARWKSGGTSTITAEAPRAGQIRKFRIVTIDPEKKAINLELA